MSKPIFWFGLEPLIDDTVNILMHVGTAAAGNHFIIRGAFGLKCDHGEDVVFLFAERLAGIEDTAHMECNASDKLLQLIIRQVRLAQLPL